MVLATSSRAPDGPAHVGPKLDAALLEGFYGSAFGREGGLRVGRCEGGLHAGYCLRGEAERRPKEDGDYRNNEARTTPLSDSFPRAHVIPFPLVVLALLYYWDEHEGFPRSAKQKGHAVNEPCLRAHIRQRNRSRLRNNKARTAIAITK